MKSFGGGVCVRARACVRACVCACACPCLCACACACACACVTLILNINTGDHGSLWKRSYVITWFWLPLEVY